MTIFEALRVATERIKNWIEENFLNKSDYNNSLATKIDINQGADNANKILSVGDDGDVEPISNIIYVGSEKPTDPNVKVWINTSESTNGADVVYVLPRIANIALSAANWVGDSEPYSQPVKVTSVTACSKVDLQPTAQQIVDLQNAETSLMIENDGGVLTCYAIGVKPTVDYNIDVLIQEVSYV